MKTPILAAQLVPSGDYEYVSSLRFQLAHLMQLAHDLGYVITVETEPLEPLAMGNARMVGNVRLARDS